MAGFSGMVLAATMAAALNLSASAPETGPPVVGKSIGPFLVETLAEGVHLFRSADGGSGRPNSLVVERDDGVLVVDAQSSPAEARELLEAIARLTPKPVKYVVYTHPHADAAGGASAFPRDVLVIASDGCRSAMADSGADFGAEAKARGGTSWKEPERRSPTAVTFTEFRLDDPKHAVQILPIQALPAHSAGDTLVWLRKEGIVAIGDLIAPSRGLWAKDANLGNWIAVLNAILSESPTVVVPLHGAAASAHDLRLTRDALAWVRGQVQQSFVDGVPTGIMPDRIMESGSLRTYFEDSVPRPPLRALIEQAVREAVNWRKKRGYDY
jgi:glyoxylase-like metal-dependent hydrolase (beta-lactamase superfamily II)